MDTRTQAIVNELADQRTSALNLCANLRGEIAVLKAENAALKKQLETVTATEPETK